MPKLFTEPKYHDEEFYKERPVSDHIHEEWHRGRLIQALELVEQLIEGDPAIKTIADFGAGNGGMLYELTQHRPSMQVWGYDLSPRAVEYAQQYYKLNVMLRNITTEPFTSEEFPDVAVLTEVLEHLVNPSVLLKTLVGNVGYVVASVPFGETVDSHYEYHLWAFDKEEFTKLFTDAGFIVTTHLVDGPSQFIVARGNKH